MKPERSDSLDMQIGRPGDCKGHIRMQYICAEQYTHTHIHTHIYMYIYSI
jgi:hypothetical protein